MQYHHCSKLKEKVRKWNMPKYEDFKCKSSWNLEYFTKKFESKLIKIENEITQIIEIKGGNHLKISLSLCKYLNLDENKKKKKFNIFWFEASNKINFYSQLFELGISEKLLTETDELVMNFEEILIRKLKKDISNEFNSIFIFNNYNDFINLEKLVHQKGITYVLIRDMYQIEEDQIEEADQKIKISAKKTSGTKDDLKIHIINLNSWLKLNGKSNKVSSQPKTMSQLNRPKTSIFVPKSFVEKLQGVCEFGTLDTPEGEFTEYYANNKEILDAILKKICTNVNALNESLKWIKSILELELCSTTISIGQFEKRLLVFVEILLVSFIDHVPLIKKYFLKILKKVDDQIQIIQRGEINVTNSPEKIIVPKSFVEKLKGFDTLNQMVEEQEKIENFLKSFQPEGENYYYTENQEILNEILNQGSNGYFRHLSVKWIENLLVEDYTTYDKKLCPFIDILIKTFMAHEYDDLQDIKILLMILRLTMIQLSIVPKTSIFVPKSFFEILQGFCKLKCERKENGEIISHSCENFMTCEQMSNEQGEIEKLLISFQPVGAYSEYYYTENQKILHDILVKICSNNYTRNMVVKGIEAVLDVHCTTNTINTTNGKFDKKLLAFVESLLMSFMANEYKLLEYFLKNLKIVDKQFDQVNIVERNSKEIIVPKAFFEIVKGFCDLKCVKREDGEIISHSCQICVNCVQMTEEQKKIRNILSGSFQPVEGSEQYYNIENEEKLREIFSNVYIRNKSVKCIYRSLEGHSIFQDEILEFSKILIESCILVQESVYLKDVLNNLAIVDLVGKWFKYFQNKDTIGRYFSMFCNRLEFDKQGQNQGDIMDTSLFEILIKVGEMFSKVNPGTGLIICQNVLEKLPQISNSIKVLEQGIVTVKILKGKCLYRKGDVSDALELFKDVLQYPRENYLDNLQLIIECETNVTKEYLLNEDKENEHRGKEITKNKQDLIIKMRKQNRLDFGHQSNSVTASFLHIMGQGEYAQALKKFEKIIRFHFGINKNWENVRKLVKSENFEKSFDTLEKHVLEKYAKFDFKVPLYKLKLYFDNKKEESSSWETSISLTEKFTNILNCFNDLHLIFPPSESGIEFQAWKNAIIISEKSSLTESEQKRIIINKNLELGISGLNDLRKISNSIELHEAEIFQWIGYCYNYQGELDKALDNYKKAEEILEKYKNFGKITLLLASNYYSLYQVHYMKGDKNTCVEYLRKAYIQFRLCQSPHLEGMRIIIEKGEEVLKTDFTEDFRRWLVSNYRVGNLKI